jgi:hypothetical protein
MISDHYSLVKCVFVDRDAKRAGPGYRGGEGGGGLFPVVVKRTLTPGTAQ